MNDARIEQEADLALCQVAIQCPDAIMKTETSEEQLNQIRTGMGEDITKLLQESGTQAICFTAEEGVKEAAPVTLSFGYHDTHRKGNTCGEHQYLNEWVKNLDKLFLHS